MIGPPDLCSFLLLILLLWTPSTLTCLHAILTFIYNLQQGKNGEPTTKLALLTLLKLEVGLFLVTFAIGNLLFSLSTFTLDSVPRDWLGLAEKTLLGFSLFWCVSWTYLGIFGVSMIYDAYKLDKPNQLDRNSRWSIVRQFLSASRLVLLISAVGGVLGLCVGFIFPGDLPRTETKPRNSKIKNGRISSVKTNAAEGRMKTIVYRGGVLKFQLPSDWAEEYGEDGGGAFYLDAESAGTLRLNVLGFDCGSPKTQETALETLQSEDKPPDTIIEKLTDGRSAIKSHSDISEEDGEEIKTWHWEIASTAKPHHLRIAIFSYTVLADQQNSPEVIKDLAMINKSLRQIEFAEGYGG